MATDGPLNRVNSLAYDAGDERRMAAIRQMPGPSSAPFSSRSGRRVNNSGLAVSVDSSTRIVTVTAGAGEVYSSTYAAQGGYEFAIASNKTVTLNARPGSGTSRIDLIVARIYDQDISVGAAREVKIEKVDGTAAASPSAPALPALSFELARLTVPNAGTITVQSSTPRLVAAGGILPVATTAERDALVTDGIAYSGLVVANEQTGRLETYIGGVWDYVGRRRTATPAVTNLTGATCAMAYSVDGDKVDCEFLITGGGAASGTIFLDAPVTIAPLVDANTALGSAMATDASVGFTSRRGVSVIRSSATQVFFLLDSATASGQLGGTTPWTWANGDTIGGKFSYYRA